VWPMTWLLHQHAGASLTALPAAEQAYFLAGMRLAVQAALQGAAAGYAPRGCVVARPSLACRSPGDADARNGKAAIDASPAAKRQRRGTSPQAVAVSADNTASATTGSMPASGRAGHTINNALSSEPTVIVCGSGYARTAQASASVVAQLAPKSGHGRAAAAGGAGAAGDALSAALEQPQLPVVHPLNTAAMNALEIVAAQERLRRSAIATAASGSRQAFTSEIGSDTAASEATRGSEAAGTVGDKRARPVGVDDGTACSFEAPEPQRAQAAVAEEPGYFCSGCDVFLTHEPGTFDAMALLHSRVARVVYGVPDDARGALQGNDGVAVAAATGSVAGPGAAPGHPSVRLHELRGLTHRYSVYRVHGLVEARLPASAGGSCGPYGVP
jgi:tRNA(Arg) A34 adenosine deaminase TadA